MIAVVVVVVVVVVLGGIDTSPITEVSETMAVTVPDGDEIGITDEYYVITKSEGSGAEAKYTYSLTYYGGETKSYTF